MATARYADRFHRHEPFSMAAVSRSGGPRAPFQNESPMGTMTMTHR